MLCLDACLSSGKLRAWLRMNAAIKERYIDTVMGALCAEEVEDLEDLRILAQLPKFDSCAGISALSAKKIRTALAVTPAVFSRAELNLIVQEDGGRVHVVLVLRTVLEPDGAAAELDEEVDIDLDDIDLGTELIAEAAQPWAPVDPGFWIWKGMGARRTTISEEDKH
jgi:hypothetical protein